MSSDDNLGQKTLDELFSQSKMDSKTKEKFLDDLDAKLKQDNHDIAVDERMEIIATCFNKNVHSVIMQVPDPEESH